MTAPPPRPDGPHHHHNRQHRQVEVLRGVMLGLLADDPTLELGEVIVMCSNIETYGLLIGAGLSVELDGPDGLGDQGAMHLGHRLTFRLTDSSLRQTNPVLGVASRPLEPADARLTAPELLNLLATPPPRRRFRRDDDAIERAGDWRRRDDVLASLGSSVPRAAPLVEHQRGSKDVLIETT